MSKQRKIQVAGFNYHEVQCFILQRKNTNLESYLVLKSESKNSINSCIGMLCVDK